jgi:hypothetical protein
MKTNMKSALNAAGAGALSVVIAASAFAAPQRGSDRGNRNDARNSNTRTESRRDARDNQRSTASGHITSFAHENGGYRVQLDRGRDAYWIPESRMSNRGRDLRVGVNISLGGIFRGGRIEVDAVSWPDDRYDKRGYDNRGYDQRGGRIEVDAVSWPDDRYDNRGYDNRGYDNRGYDNRGYDQRGARDETVRGIVERVDVRSGSLLLRVNGRTLDVDMRDAGRYGNRNSRLDLGDLRRGDAVTLNGQWLRDGRFIADSIDSVNTRR